MVRRRAAALAAADLEDHVGDGAEAGLEGRPVLEVDGLADLLAEAAQPRAPAAAGQRLGERLDVVQPGGQQEGQRGGDEQVVDVAAQLLVDPGELLGVEEVAVVGLEHARGAGVDDDEPGLGAEVAGVAPAVGRRLLVGAVGERVEQRAGVPAGLVGVGGDRRPTPGRPRARRARGCRGAGRPSTTPARRRSGRATSRWPPSRPSTPARCSSRRGCRGRRRSSALGSVESSQRLTGSDQASR